MRQNKDAKRVGKGFNYRKSLSYYLSQCQQRKNNLKMSLNFNSQILSPEHQHKIMPKLLSLKKSNFPRYDLQYTDNASKLQSHSLNKPDRKNAIIKLFASEQPRLETNHIVSIRASAESSPQIKPKSENSTNLAILLSNKLAQYKFRKHKSRQLPYPPTPNHKANRYGPLHLLKHNRKSNQYQSSILKLQPWQTRGDALNETTQLPSKFKI